MKHLLFSFLALVITTPAFASGVWLDAQDIQAGEDMNFRATGLLDGETVNLGLERPDGSVIETVLVANDLGNINTLLSGVHTRKAGSYEVTLNRPTLSEQLSTTSNVIAGNVSAYRSEVSIKENAGPADGNYFLTFTGKLKDTYGNTVAGAPVKVISSRQADTINVTPISDSGGNISGKVTSKTPGISILSVMSGSTVLQDRPELVFHIQSQGLTSVGQGFSDFLKAQIFDEDTSSELSYFDIEDLKSEAVEGESLSLRVVARDPNGDVYQNYNGTIRFSTVGNELELPLDYGYIREDQGTHEFFLALRFNKQGTYTLTVRDVDDPTKKGEVSIRILPKDGNTQPDTSSGENGTITIITPENDGVYKNSRLTITGQAPGIPVVKVRANSVQILIDDLETNEDGSFVYQTPTLADGIHEFQVTNLDESIKSEKIQVAIDTSPPPALSLSQDPEGIKDPNQIFKLVLSASEPLSSAQCVVNEANFILNATLDQENTFTSELAAPSECGQYPVSCTIADMVGNQLEEPNAAVIQVCGGEQPVVEKPKPQVPDENPSTNTAPTAPSNVTGEPAESKVTLYWSPATDDKEVISYRISYLESGTTTILENMTPDNRTQWYIDGLKECVKYKFTITALDEEGAESVPSSVIQQAPVCSKVLHTSAPKTPNAGSKFPWYVMVFSLLIGGSVMALFRKA